MPHDFPNAHEAKIQLLLDRHNFLYHSAAQLTEQITGKAEDKVEPLLDVVINNRPNSNSTAFERLKHQYNGLRLQTLLGLVDPNGVFRATVPFDLELCEQLGNEGGWYIFVWKNQENMDISTERLFV